jgi:hypothetical protein
MNTIPEPSILCNSENDAIRRRAGFRVPFGLRDGRFWAPAEVLKGKACNCDCPGCGAPLAAKAQASRCKRPHFAHLADARCATGRETGIHGRAKQVIAERRILGLPAWGGDLLDMPNPPFARDDAGFGHRGRFVDYPARQVRLVHVEVERSFGDYQPDVYARDDAGELLIEVRVTHAVDDRKATRVRAHGRRMIEIDLSRLDRETPHDPDAFEQAVLFDATNRHWISCPDALEDWRASKHELDAQVDSRNREIRQVREQHAQAEEQRQVREALETKDKTARKAYMHSQLRAKHAEDLAQLALLTAPERIDSTLREYKIEAEARVGKLLDRVPPAVRSACLRAHHDAWVFGVDPALWQLLAYQHFMASQPPGSRLNQKDVAAWVRRSFNPDRALYRLFVTQYAGRAEARRAGFSKQKLDYWAFTEDENARIPNFYEPINEFIRRLEGARIVRPLPHPLGEYEVQPPSQACLHPSPT